MNQTGTDAFLVRAAGAFRRGGWVFTGFHWPVLAGHLASVVGAAVLGPADPEFIPLFEAGAACNAAPDALPSSTTDYAAYDNVCCFRGSTADVLLRLIPHCDRVVLDAGTVDVQGRINSTAVGDMQAPTVRLAGGGGAPDAAGAAHDLVLLHGSYEPRRIQGRVEHVTSAPGPHAIVTLETRWGAVRLGSAPTLLTLADGPGQTEFVEHLTDLGVTTDHAAPVLDATPEEIALARAVLQQAVHRGYAVARRAVDEFTPA